MNLSNIKRLVERDMIAAISVDGKLNELPWWAWEGVFDLFTHE